MFNHPRLLLKNHRLLLNHPRLLGEHGHRSFEDAHRRFKDGHRLFKNLRFPSTRPAMFDAGIAKTRSSGGIKNIDRADAVATELMTPAKPKKPRGGTPRQKNDPKYEAAARDYRDKFLEQVNAGLILPSGCDEQGSRAQRYDVSRQLEAAQGVASRQSTPLLDGGA